MTNILIILTDQQSASAMSCAGNTDLATPHMDRLAARGTRFTNAYCSQPLCTPSRASMWTGRMPTEVGVVGNAGRLSPLHVEQQLGRWLGAAGYDCGYAGKWHLPELDVPAWSGWRAVHPETEVGLVDSCAQFLNEPRDAPFVLVASLTEPHGICEWARGQPGPSGPVPDVAWTEWPLLPANHAPAPESATLPLLARGMTPHANPIDGWETDRWRRYLHAYHRLCERADAQVGALLDALESSGHGDDTIIVFSADHGDQMTAHGWNQKWVLYEESVRVPLIVVDPTSPRGGQVSDRLVSVGLDLMPTLCDAAGIETPPGLTGHSLRTSAVARATDVSSREELHVETRWEIPGVHDLTGRSVRDARFKYTCYAWGSHREQLIDLDDDPGEMRNLARVGSHQSRLDQMRDRVRAECRRVGDTRFARFVPASGSPPH